MDNKEILKTRCDFGWRIREVVWIFEDLTKKNRENLEHASIFAKIQVLNLKWYINKIKFRILKEILHHLWENYY